MILKDISYYQTGGTCDAFYTPESTEELAETIIHLKAEGVPYFLLGAGSNSLIMDDHWPGAVIAFRRMTSIEAQNSLVTAEAGAENTAFAEFCLEHSLKGASWMYFLPGEIGATVRMNARCYGGEICRVVESVTVVTGQGRIRKLQADQVFLGYKHTLFMSTDDIIASAAFRLEKGEPEEIRSHMDACRSDREKKRQFLYPSCGCVFKNNYEVGIPSGILLDQAGVRKFNTRRVEISPYHANFVFNRGASAVEILQTTLQMRDAVYETFGVWLEYEMEILGALPDKLQNRVAEAKPQRPDKDRLKKLSAHAGPC